jgi:ABC-type transporter Mla subunit MlaD
VNEQTISERNFHEWAANVSSLIVEADAQQSRCDELLRQLATASETLRSRTRELARDMPRQIAQQAAKEVVQGVANQVEQSVAEVLRSANTDARSLMTSMTQAAGAYRKQAQKCIFYAGLTGGLVALFVAILVIAASKALSIF